MIPCFVISNRLRILAIHLWKMFLIFYQAKPEIHHLFHSPDPRPPRIVAIAFTGLCLCPFLVLVFGVSSFIKTTFIDVYVKSFNPDVSYEWRKKTVSNINLLWNKMRFPKPSKQLLLLRSLKIILSKNILNQHTCFNSL